MEQDVLKSKIEDFYRLCKYSNHMVKSDDELLDICIDKTWPDAIARERYKGKDNSIILQNRIEIKNLFKKYLKQLTVCKSKFEFSQWHKTICNDTSYCMVPGIWQKLINMALKHIYVINYETDRLGIFLPIMPLPDRYNYCRCFIKGHAN